MANDKGAEGPYKFPGHTHFLRLAESDQTDLATLTTARKQRAVLECGELLAQAVDAAPENQRAIFDAALRVSEGINIAKLAVDLMVDEVRSELGFKATTKKKVTGGN